MGFKFSGRLAVRVINLKTVGLIFAFRNYGEIVMECGNYAIMEFLLTEPGDD